MLYQRRLKSQMFRSDDEWQERNSRNAQINEIILIKEMNQLHGNCILLMFNVRYDITYILKLCAVLNDLLHWLCSTSERFLKHHVLLSVQFHDCSV
jgi:hypothetical protein